MSVATVTRGYAPRGDATRSSYLGYPLEITNGDVSIFDRSGRKIATVASVGAARLFIRGYRREPDLHATKAEPTNDPAKVLVGSDNKGA